MAEQNITKRRLNDKQRTILHELYCYRVATSDLLTNSLHASNIDDMNKRLHRLVDYGYIGRKHEKSYRLMHRPASYYLLTEGANVLAANAGDKYSKRILANIKRMKEPSYRFIKTSLSIFSIRNSINAACGTDASIFTSSETAKYEYFPNKRPDLYIQYRDNNTLKQFFLIYIESNKPMYANIRRVMEYAEYTDEGEWEITNTPLPALLLVCDRKQLIDRTLTAINSIADDIDDELEIYITSIEEINTNTKTVLWKNVFDPDKTAKVFQ